MGFFISLTSRLGRTPHTLFYPLLLHSIPHPPPHHALFPKLSESYNSSATPKFHPQKDPFGHAEFGPDPHRYESSDDLDTSEVELCSDSSVDELLRVLGQTKQLPSDEDAIALLQDSGIQPDSHLVYNAMWVLRDEWRLALLAFTWAGKCGSNSLRQWNLMVWILGRQRRFDVAWSLVRDMHRSAIATREALLIIIKRYAAADEAGKAIKTFHAMDKFKTAADSNAFYTLLRALCNHRNIEEAEELMFIHKKLFPLETESFNIILNGWCNIIVDVVEAKRVWREMSKCCVTPDSTSYTCMISCLSKVGNLFDSLRLYDEIKKRGWVPDFGVYNSLIYILTKENCLKEAQNLRDKMIEMGLKPNSSTYDCMIFPLCEAQKLEEARGVFNQMLDMELKPTVGTYHAFARAENMVGTLKLLNRMHESACGPSSLTFLLILEKFFRRGLPDKALKIWSEMKRYGVDPDSTHYMALVQGLAACGWLNKAREFHYEMKFRGFSDDPKLKKLFKELDHNSKNHEGRRRHSKGGRSFGIYSMKPIMSSSGMKKDKIQDEESEIRRMIKSLGE